MESRDRDGPGDLSFFLDLLALAETTRRMARVTSAMGKEFREAGSTPTNAGLIRRTVTAEIPNLLAEAERAGIPAHDLSTAAIEAWASRMFWVDETGAVWEGPWNHQEDLPQWLVDGKRFV